MILALLKNSSKIQWFGDSVFETETGYIIDQNTANPVYCSKQISEIVEWDGDFPYESFQPCKYLLKNGQIMEDPDYVKPSEITEYGVPEDVVQGIEQRAVNQFLAKLSEELTENGYEEI